MDSFLLKLFQAQIAIQCKFALLSHDELTRRIASLHDDHDLVRARTSEVFDMPDNERLAKAIEIGMDWSAPPWLAIQSFLSAIANISKALWGQRGKFGVEREPLRRSLGVADSSPLRPTSMRNHFDHFDERLDAWFAISTDHNYVDMNIGNVAAMIKGIPEDEMFRSFDPSTGDLIFWGDRYNLPTIVVEVQRIMPLAIQASA